MYSEGPQRGAIGLCRQPRIFLAALPPLEEAVGGRVVVPKSLD